MGARVIVTSSSDEKLLRARALGATDTINYRTTPDWAAAVLEMTDGEGVDVVLDVVGGDGLRNSVRAAKVCSHWAPPCRVWITFLCGRCW